MEIIYGINKIQERHRHAVVALGFFDGFHRGHQALIHVAKKLSRGAPVLLYTFDRHPLEIVNPAYAPPLLSTLEEKIGLTQNFPINYFLVGTFDHALSQLEPNEFMKKILVDRLSAQGVVVGFNYHYGKGHKGNPSTLRQSALVFNVAIHVVDPVIVNDIQVSSSEIRKLLQEGNVEEANLFLGHSYSLEGPVVKGHGEGQKLGIPTANIEISTRKLIPKSGIYAGIIEVENSRAYPGLLSIGDRPTFDGKEIAIEAHLFDFNDNLYGKKIKVEIVAWRREQKKFPSTQALVEAMQEDIAWGRELLEAKKENG